MTGGGTLAAEGMSPSADNEATRCKVLTRSSSVHPADWGRAISLALGNLAVQVAFTLGEPEPGILVGRLVRLRIDANGDGVVIEVALLGDHGLRSDAP